MQGGSQTGGGSSVLRMEGLAKMEAAVAGSEVEGFYLASQGSNITLFPAHILTLPLRRLTVPLPPLSPICPIRGPQDLKPLLL